jgi:HD superfamily phosphohydrolase
MMAGQLPTSSKWQGEADQVFARFERSRRRERSWGRVDHRHFAADLLAVLHSLVSGTVDVDRMDYLIRDSYHCGVPYGHCDTVMLIGNLSLGGVNGRLELFLNRKAVDSLDDLLWSRYQLFIQVLNHKANVAMNTLLSEAISDAIRDSLLRQPESVDDYLLFTDDHVMATITNACFRGRLEKRKYAKTLVDRRLPMHLGAEEDPGTNTKRRRARLARARAAAVPVEHVFEGIAESTLLKPGRFPIVLDWNRATRQYDLHPYEQFSQFRHKGIPSLRRVIHYYIDRDDLSVSKGQRP